MSMSAWDKVEIARNPNRPTSLAYIENITSGFIELHGDRQFRDDPAIVAGIAHLQDMPVTVISIEKGTTTKEKARRNFGCPHPEGYRKALRLMRQAEKFRRPVLCIVDTQGAYCGVGAEERGQGDAIAQNLFHLSSLKTPVITIIIGEGGSGGALALAVADRVYMMQYAIYSILSPEGFASILWKDSGKAKEASEVMKITASELKELGIIDGIIKEPMGGLAIEDKAVMEDLSQLLKKEFQSLLRLEDHVLLKQRFEKFRRLGSNCID